MAMDYIKIFIIGAFIATGFFLLLYRFAGFDSDAAIFIATGTVMLSYIIPQLRKMHREQKARKNNL